MLDSVIIIGLVICIVQIIKKSILFFETEKGSLYVPIMVFVFAGIFNILNGVLFSGDILTAAVIAGYLKDGLVLGAASGGIYSMGKTYLDSNSTTEE